ARPPGRALCRRWVRGRPAELRPDRPSRPDVVRAVMFRVAALLASMVVAAPLSAQTRPVRLAGRVPAAALPAIDSIIATAVAESLPTEPLVPKALEGSAKHVPPDRLVTAARRAGSRARRAPARGPHPGRSRAAHPGDAAERSAGGSGDATWNEGVVRATLTRGFGCFCPQFCF